MRTAFIAKLQELAAKDERIWLINGDLGYSVLEPFAANFPGRYLNAGIAEQNMTGIAAGLALSGKVVFTYSIANFPTLRCLEQIRNDICYHGANVKIVSVGGGYTYGPQGYTHHGVEDLGIMRLLPNMAVVAPADPVETALTVDLIAAHDGPSYLRLGKAGEAIVHEGIPQMQFGKAIEVFGGSDVAVLTTGGVLELAVEARRILVEMGISVRLVSVPFISPIDQEMILSCVEGASAVITVEEHGPGGLGTVIAEIIGLSGCGARFRPLRLRPEAIEYAGSQEFLRTQNQVSSAHLVAAATELLNLAPSGS